MISLNIWGPHYIFASFCFKTQIASFSERDKYRHILTDSTRKKKKSHKVICWLAKSYHSESHSAGLTLKIRIQKENLTSLSFAVTCSRSRCLFSDLLWACFSSVGMKATNASNISTSSSPCKSCDKILTELQPENVSHRSQQLVCFSGLCVLTKTGTNVQLIWFTSHLGRLKYLKPLTK